MVSTLFQRKDIYLFFIIPMVLLVRVEMNAYINLDGLAQQRSIKL